MKSIEQAVEEAHARATKLITEAEETGYNMYPKQTGKDEEWAKIGREAFIMGYLHQTIKNLCVDVIIEQRKLEYRDA